MDKEHFNSCLEACPIQNYQVVQKGQIEDGDYILSSSADKIVWYEAFEQQVGSEINEYGEFVARPITGKKPKLNKPNNIPINDQGDAGAGMEMDEFSGPKTNGDIDLYTKGHIDTLAKVIEFVCFNVMSYMRKAKLSHFVIEGTYADCIIVSPGHARHYMSKIKKIIDEQ